MHHDPSCVYRAASVEQADIIVAWLAERGVNAFVKDRHVIGTVYVPFATAPKGVEVCVLDGEQAKRATELLSEHADELSHRPQPIPPGKVFRAVCEECGRPTDFPSELFGSVQTCPHCRANMDVNEPPAVC
ncbi:MAG: DUF2007 domain-containing protein [Phycisphaerales bacterium]|nr:DUF2007 domain-containing protein [Phycisphaerales bacterium]